MVNHQALLLLGDSSRCSAQTCQRALRIFAEFDLSLPRALVPADLERRFSWPAGAGLKTLNALVDLGVLSSMSHGRASSGGMTLFILAQAFAWTPASLQAQWAMMEKAGARASVAQTAP